MADKSKLKALSDKNYARESQALKDSFKKTLGKFPTTTVNKNSPLSKAMGDSDSFLARKMKLTGSALTAGMVKPSTVGKVASNIFKKSIAGRVLDTAVKFGAGVGAGYEIAKSKLKNEDKKSKDVKVDKKATGGMADYIKDLL